MGLVCESNKIRKAKDSKKIRLLVDEWIENKGYLSNDIGIDKLGKRLGINRTYISNYINDTYHSNFNTWIHNMRIADAQKLIIDNPDMTMGQIAVMTGYSDQAHFCKQFKAVSGKSPIKWKKENLKK